MIDNPYPRRRRRGRPTTAEQEEAALERARLAAEAEYRSYTNGNSERDNERHASEYGNEPEAREPERTSDANIGRHDSIPKPDTNRRFEYEFEIAPEDSRRVVGDNPTTNGYHSRTGETASTAPSPERLAWDIPEPPVPEQPKRGRPRKKPVEVQQVQRVAESVGKTVRDRLPFSTPITSKPLTEGEADELRPRVIEAIKDYGYYLDGFIKATNRKHVDVVIWGDLDDIEAGVLADIWLARARKKAAAAHHLRGALAVRERYLKAAAITFPRFWATYRVYVENGIGIRFE